MEYYCAGGWGVDSVGIGEAAEVGKHNRVKIMNTGELKNSLWLKRRLFGNQG